MIELEVMAMTMSKAVAARVQGQVGWWVGLVTSIAVALAGQADQLPPQVAPYINLLALVGTAVNAYMIQRPSGS